MHLILYKHPHLSSDRILLYVEKKPSFQRRLRLSARLYAEEYRISILSALIPFILITTRWHYRASWVQLHPRCRVLTTSLRKAAKICVSGNYFLSISAVEYLPGDLCLPQISPRSKNAVNNCFVGSWNLLSLCLHGKSANSPRIPVPFLLSNLTQVQFITVESVYSSLLQEVPS